MKYSSPYKHLTIENIGLLRHYLQENGVYYFSFNGQEKDDEVSGAGNTMGAEYWEYDSRLGRRWNRDPKSNPSISDYACFSNNPICFIDVKGDSAWSIRNSWNSKYIRQFRNEVTKTIKKFESENKKFTCEDLALDVLLTFSKNNNLPLKWSTNDKNFDAASNEYNDFVTFVIDVKSYTGARDFGNNKNTSEINYENIKRGDVAMLTASGRSNPNHIQLITNLYIDEGVIKGYNAAQGNFNWLGRVGSNNPNSAFYMGVTVQHGYYSKDGDYWSNRTENSLTTAFTKSHYTVKYRTFNFNNWNK